MRSRAPQNESEIGKCKEARAGHRPPAAWWFNAFGMTDLVVALALGGLTGFGVLSITPSGAPISMLPLALIPAAAVPLLLALHITSVSVLVRARRGPSPATGPLTAGATPPGAGAESPASRAR